MVWVSGWRLTGTTWLTVTSEGTTHWTAGIKKKRLEEPRGGKRGSELALGLGAGWIERVL